ncbi:tetratricopeptide repeat protein [Methanolobus sp. WCC5]|uniref:tetratricopeptide repeat protein n=1 Tax=Methanolobus sp. WCC5 TaxID=3125785 RepID=UPI00324B473F
MRKNNSRVSVQWTEKGLLEKDPFRKMHYFDLALELDPCNPTALNNKGMLLHREGKFREAVECYDRILGQYNMSGSLAALYNKGLALKEMGRYEAALNFMSKALKIQPDNNKIKGHIENLNAIIEGKADTKTRITAYVPAKDLAVNQIYDRWEPPAVSTLLTHSMKCSLRDIKYRKGFGEDIIKEKLIQDNLSQKVYCCRSCQFQKRNVCHHRDTKAMAVAPTAICRNFRPDKMRI